MSVRKLLKEATSAQDPILNEVFKPIIIKTPVPTITNNTQKLKKSDELYSLIQNNDSPTNYIRNSYPKIESPENQGFRKTSILHSFNKPLI